MNSNMAGLDEAPTAPEASPEAMKPRFGRRLYLVIGLIAIAIIATASIIVFTQFPPSARGEPVSLGYDYSVGEKMTYEMIIRTEMMDTEVSTEATLEMEVISFDGENWTIRTTVTSEVLEEYSVTMKMNKTGHVIEYIEFPPEFEETFPSFLEMPGLGTGFPKENFTVGESWEMPFDIELEDMGLNGIVGYKLSKITNVKVPAGTYEAVKIDIKPSVIQVSASREGIDAQGTANVDGYLYMGKDVGCLIKSRFTESVTMTANGQTVSMEMTLQIQLVEHVK